MSFREVVLAIDGLREKDKYHHDLLRRATLIIGISGLGGKEIAKKFERLWPSGDQANVTTIRDRAMAQLKKFKEMEQQASDEKTVKEIIDARRSKNSSRS